MFSKMGAQRVATESSAQVPLETMLAEGVRGAADVAALASAEPNRLAVMVWHYHDDDVPGPDAAVNLAVAGLPAATSEAKLAHYRFDEHHSNAYAAWRRMGSPIAPCRGLRQQAMIDTSERSITSIRGQEDSGARDESFSSLCSARPRCDPHWHPSPRKKRRHAASSWPTPSCRWGADAVHCPDPVCEKQKESSGPGAPHCRR
jgi:hypothetical protein